MTIHCVCVFGEGGGGACVRVNVCVSVCDYKEGPGFP